MEEPTGLDYSIDSVMWLETVYFIDYNTGWIVSGYPDDLVLKTTNGGEDWVEQTSNIIGGIHNIGRLNEVYFIDDSIGGLLHR